MTYQTLRQLLETKGYQRVERDDRLLDIFPAETREKGVELWEKWEEERIQLVKLTLPFQPKRLWLWEIPRPRLEKMLLINEPALLSDVEPKAIELAAVEQL